MGVHKRVIALGAVLALLGAACGSSDDGRPSGNAAAGGGDEPLTISAPENGAEVSLPFTLELESADPLGAPDTGNHHVHVFFDGDDSAYEVVTSDTFEVTDLSAGDHTLTASLRNADHSPAGSEVTIDLTVAGGSDGGSKSGSDGSKDSNPSDDTNYGY